MPFQPGEGTHLHLQIELVQPGIKFAGVMVGLAHACILFSQAPQTGAWLYNAAGRVVFAAVLFHGVGNVLNELVSDASPLILLVVRLMVTLAAVAFAWRNFSRHKEGAA